MEKVQRIFTSCVIKIASRCNLNCGYCYIYNKGDDSYKSQPKYISSKTILEFVSKLDNYFDGYEYDNFNFVFHGGEPLLASIELYTFFIENLNAVCKKNNVKPVYCIQTNGVLIDTNWMRFFKKNNIHVGISMDGTKISNDKNRIYHNGKSSYSDILKGFNLFKQKMGKSPGILSVIDLLETPLDVYEHYRELNAEYVNLLFPDDTYDDDFNDDLTLGKWLLEIFKLWIQNQDVKIDQFEVLLSIIYGADFVGDEYYGTRLNNTFILETDGEIQANDPLRVCNPNIHITKLNVEENEIWDLMENPLAKLYYNAKSMLCNKCDKCDLSNICSGGYLINRYSKQNGFDNPSIYCKSLAFFIVNVQNMVVEFTNPQLDSERRITPFNLQEIMSYCENTINIENYELSKFKV